MAPHPSRVTVWLDSGPLDSAALDQAAAASRVRGLPLRLLHAVPPADQTAAERWIAGAAAGRVLRDAFRHVRTCWPGVPVTARLVVVAGPGAGVRSASLSAVVVDH
jgi:hypothetical protein